jgi:inner membrane protein involved in colicin E2 resistance
MRTSALLNGGLIGFSIGFIAASLSLYRIVSLYLPAYAAAWQFKGVAIIGGVGLILGIVFELLERRKLKKQTAEEETKGPGKDDPAA